MEFQRECTVLDLFSGIGGISLGLHWARMRTLAFCESDPFARAVLARHWPGVPIHPDIRTFHRHASPTVLCGGFPCQDTSLAGRGAGLSGARSGLWAHMARLVAECRPRWVVAENVPGLRSRGADQVLDELAALGYAAWPLVVGAAHAGAPHRRARAWIVARRLSPDAAGAGLALGIGGATGPAPLLPTERRGGWPPPPPFRRVGDGLPAGLDRTRRIQALGNAAVPAAAAAIGRALRHADRLTLHG